MENNILSNEDICAVVLEWTICFSSQKPPHMIGWDLPDGTYVGDTPNFDISTDDQEEWLYPHVISKGHSIMKITNKHGTTIHIFKSDFSLFTMAQEKDVRTAFLRAFTEMVNKDG